MACIALVLAFQTDSTRIASLILAYEPVWAIGTGRNATAAEAGEAHTHLRRRLREWFGGAQADQSYP